MVSNLMEGKSFETFLEIGTGSGIYIMELLKHAGSVIGMDIHPSYHGVQKMLVSEGVDLRRVVCVSVLEHFPDPRPALEEIRCVVKPQSLAVMGFPADTRITKLIFASLGCNAQEIHPVSHDTILAAIEDVLSIDELSVFLWARTLFTSHVEHMRIKEFY